MKRVLVFPCGSEIGLEVGRALVGSSYFEAIGASSVPDHGRFAYGEYLQDVPQVDNEHFVVAIERIVREQAIDFIVPAHDSVVLKLAEFQHALSAPVVTSPLATCRICRSKSATYRHLDGTVPTPVLYEAHPPRFPVFLKPDVGQGSRGTHLARSAGEVAHHLRRDPSLLVLEYLPGPEYTVDCFTDRHGTLRFAAGRHRRRIAGGISVNSVEVSTLPFVTMAKAINARMALHGAWFFQVKERADGELVLMEVAPRIPGTAALFRADGVNLVQLALFDRMGVDVEILRNGLPLEIDRALTARFRLGYAYSCVYVDLDDTLIFQGKVHPPLVQFLHSARNAGKRIVLLSRHRLDVSVTLRQHAVSDALFDRIHILRAGEPKSDFVKERDAILIDDSFAERKEVARRTGIPVFALDALEALSG